MEHSFLVHDDGDDVGVAVVDLEQGREVVGVYMHSGKRVSVSSRAEVPLGHKIALRDLDEGAEVLEYGVPIGRTTRSVQVGDYVHTHNLRTARW
ncbi:MAG: UxaA family hydrolase [Actinomycetota bacterium]